MTAPIMTHVSHFSKKDSLSCFLCHSLSFWHISRNKIKFPTVYSPDSNQVQRTFPPYLHDCHSALYPHNQSLVLSSCPSTTAWSLHPYSYCTIMLGSIIGETFCFWLRIQRFLHNWPSLLPHKLTPLFIAHSYIDTKSPCPRESNCMSIVWACVSLPSLNAIAAMKIKYAILDATGHHHWASICPVLPRQTPWSLISVYKIVVLWNHFLKLEFKRHKTDPLLSPSQQHAA